MSISVRSSLLAVLLGAACTREPALPPTLPLQPGTAAPLPGLTHAIVLPESASPVSFEKIARFPEPGWQVPRLLRLSPDNKALTYLMSETEAKGDEMALMSLDLATGKSSVLVRADDLVGSSASANPSRTEELRNERQRTRIKGITDYHWAKDSPIMAIPGASAVFIRRSDGTIQKITGADVAAVDPKLCADGSKLAYVNGTELEVVDVVSGKAASLTSKAPKGVTRGVSDFNAQEEFDEPSGFFWSPDGKRIAYLEVDESRVAEVPVLGHRGGAPDLMQQKYPEAGKTNPSVKVFVVDVATKKSTQVRLPAGVGEGAYLGRFRFTPDSKRLVFTAVERSQRRAHLIVSDLERKASRLLDSRDAIEGWLTMTEIALAKDGSAAFFLAERRGHDHLATVGLEGNQPATFLTAGDWDITSLVGIDETSGAIAFMSTQGDVLGRRLFTLDPKREAATPVLLTEAPGTYLVSWGKAGAFAAVHSAREVPPHAFVRAEGRSTEIAMPRDPEIDALGLRVPEPIELTVAGGTKLYGALLAPRNLDPTKRYPLVQMVYGGPGVQTIQNRWLPRLVWQHLADRGFFVMQIDNRGSAGRGPAFEAPIHKKLGEVELADQLAALDHVLAHHPIDPQRTAIYGHSYGGFMAAYAMLAKPGRYHAAIAASPVTDWRLYDTGYTERFMGTPEANPTGYDASDLEKLAKNLTGQLLVVHALMDENVHFQHTADLIDALVKEKKDFRMFVFPGERHGYRSPAARVYAAQLSTRFLVETLAPPN